MQDQGYDTVEANHQLGFALMSATSLFALICSNSLASMSPLVNNNPKKVEILTEAGLILLNAYR
ncbi:hypothetical protein DMI69_25845 [Escherichia coli]|nr:hypothetical protein [Escherichia coli]